VRGMQRDKYSAENLMFELTYAVCLPRTMYQFSRGPLG